METKSAKARRSKFLDRTIPLRDSLAGLIVTFFSGICLEQNLGPDRARITKKIDAFMRLIRAI